MQELKKGRYQARLAADQTDIERVLALRLKRFPPRQSRRTDRDRFDDICRHVLVENTKTGRLVCCFRLLHLDRADEIETSYSAQFYDLSRLSSFGGSMAEVGRFCTADVAVDPDILRLAWGFLTRFVDREEVAFLFGCSSFSGSEVAGHAGSFHLLRQNNLAPEKWMPGRKAAQTIAFSDVIPPEGFETQEAIGNLPPLLRSYLAMGGWVSDHAVVDRDLNTLHVFTGLEISAVPPGRARVLRALGGAVDI